jgi:predicted metal-binding membrane protein
MGSMMASPWTAAALAATMVMWTVMMAVMMLPATIPVMRLVSLGNRAALATGEEHSPLAAFVAGYLLVWTAFSACATLLQANMTSSMWLNSEMRLSSAGARGAALIIAGTWQLTPWKNACLTGCRLPLSFALHRWKSGATGALRMGIDHGLTCLGCCWALMLVLFATGVMNFAAVAALTLLVLIERTISRGRAVGIAAGVMLVLWGVVIAAR